MTRNRENEHLQQSFIDFGNIPGKKKKDVYIFSIIEYPWAWDDSMDKNACHQA